LLNNVNRNITSKQLGGTINHFWKTWIAFLIYRECTAMINVLEDSSQFLEDLLFTLYTFH